MVQSCFAVIDDSLVCQDGIFVYSHVLIPCEGLPSSLVFSGDNRQIYMHEDTIRQFIEDNLEIEHRLYACSHYMMYGSVWGLVYGCASHNDMPKIIRKEFIRAHHAAKAAAWRGLTSILNG